MELTTGRSGDERTVVMVDDFDNAEHFSPTEAREFAIKLLELAQNMETTKGSTRMAENSPLDSLKNAVLRTTDSMSGATDSICGSMCNWSHESDLEWFDSIAIGLWLVLAEHVPGLTVKDGLVQMTLAARRAVHTYDDGGRVMVHLKLGRYVTDYYPRFDGPYAEFLEKFQLRSAALEAETIAYEAAHPAAARGGDFE